MIRICRDYTTGRQFDPFPDFLYLFPWHVNPLRHSLSVPQFILTTYVVSIHAEGGESDDIKMYQGGSTALEGSVGSR